MITEAWRTASDPLSSSALVVAMYTMQKHLSVNTSNTLILLLRPQNYVLQCTGDVWLHHEIEHSRMFDLYPNPYAKSSHRETSSHQTELESTRRAFYLPGHPFTPFPGYLEPASGYEVASLPVCSMQKIQSKARSCTSTFVHSCAAHIFKSKSQRWDSRACM